MLRDWVGERRSRNISHGERRRSARSTRAPRAVVLNQPDLDVYQKFKPNNRATPRVAAKRIAASCANLKPAEQVMGGALLNAAQQCHSHRCNTYSIRQSKQWWRCRGGWYLAAGRLHRSRSRQESFREPANTLPSTEPSHRFHSLSIRLPCLLSRQV